MRTRQGQTFHFTLFRTKSFTIISLSLLLFNIKTLYYVFVLIIHKYCKTERKHLNLVKKFQSLYYTAQKLNIISIRIVVTIFDTEITKCKT